MAKKRVLIAGGSGFIGTHLAMYLSQHYHVYGLYFNTLPAVQGVQFFRCNLLVPSDFVRVIGVLRPDVLVNAFGIRSVTTCEEHRKYAEDVHAGIIGNLARAGKINYHIVYLSSEEVYSGTPGSFHQETKIQPPSNSMGQSKRRGEDSLTNQNLRHTVFRLGTVYGVGHGGRPTVFEQWASSLLKGEKVDVAADRFMSPLFVEDLGPAIRFALENQPKPGAVYNLGGTDRVSPFALALRFCQHFGYNKELLHPVTQESLPFKDPHGKDVSLSSKKFTRTYGFLPRGIESGLRLMKARYQTGWTDDRELEGQQSTPDGTSVMLEADQDSDVEPSDSNF